MKRIIILSVLSLIVLASCNRKAEYQPETFVSFHETEIMVPETEDEVFIPVHLYNPTGAKVDVSVKVSSDDAVEGEDFEIVSPASGIISFSEDTKSVDVVVKVIGQEGVFTGAKSVNLQLESLTDGVSLGALSAAVLTIQDLDHPLAEFVGKWKGTLIFASDPPQAIPDVILDIAIDTKDETYTKLIIDGLEANYANYALPMSAVYDSKNSKIIVPAGQVPMFVSDSYSFIFIGLDDEWANILDLEFAYDSAAKTLTQLCDYGVMNKNDGKIYSAYIKGAVFTKQ